MYLRRFLINCCVKAVLLLIRYYNLLLKKGKADGMKNILKEDLIYEILSVVAEIPLGKVATYGQIARLIGREKYSRLVGRLIITAGIHAIAWLIMQEDLFPDGASRGICFEARAYQ